MNLLQPFSECTSRATHIMIRMQAGCAKHQREGAYMPCCKYSNKSDNATFVHACKTCKTYHTLAFCLI